MNKKVIYFTIEIYHSNLLFIAPNHAQVGLEIFRSEGSTLILVSSFVISI